MITFFRPAGSKSPAPTHVLAGGSERAARHTAAQSLQCPHNLRSCLVRLGAPRHHPPARPESMGNVMRPADWHMQSPAAWLPAASSSHRVLTMARPTVDARMQAASNALIAFDLLSVALCCAGLLASERFEPLADWQAAVAAVTAVQAQKPSKLARAFRHSYLTCCSSPSSKAMSLLASEAVNNDAMTASRSGLVCLQDCRIRRADDDDNAGGCCCCCCCCCCCWRCWGW